MKFYVIDEAEITALVVKSVKKELPPKTEKEREKEKWEKIWASKPYGKQKAK